LEERRSALEAQVSQMEEEIAGIEAGLANFVSVDETLRLDGLLRERRTALERLMAEWEDVAQALEANA
jgi:hypothetical protein